MVCDVVEQPIRIAGLAADWLARGLCRDTIFNLKLPMKKRYEEWLRCRDEIAARLDRAGVSFLSRAKQLYHDREEITVYLSRTSALSNWYQACRQKKSSFRESGDPVS
jgi:23S rRNA (cytidine2498-2'-O)-methyltransferase